MSKLLKNALLGFPAIFLSTSLSVLSAEEAKTVKSEAEAVVAQSAVSDKVDPIVFLDRYCVSCHGEEKQKGKRRVDELAFEITDFEVMEHWQE